ncbi:MAG: phosphonate ABC transporter, permease protein PhnE [Desertimonas sp.]
MTDDAGPVTAPPGAPSRPQRPAPSAFALGITVGFVALTTVTWFTSGFSVGAIWSGLFRENDALRAIAHADLGQFNSDRTLEAFFDTVRMAVLGTTGGALVALPLAMASSRHGVPIRWLVWLFRGFNNIIRSFPDVLWAMLFVAAVGVGNLAGTLALFFFTIAVVTKLMADSLDAIDTAPLEAADAAGLGWAGKQRVAVFPQILPSYVSYVIYAFELNVRGSAVLGLVGAGGVGNRLEFFRNRGAWEQVWGIVAMFLVVVLILDRLSSFLRRRLV